MLNIFSGRESKGSRSIQQASDGDSEENGNGTDNGNQPDGQPEKGKKGRPKSPCEAIPSEPYINIEIVKFGREPNNTFSSGTYIINMCKLNYRVTKS